MTFHQASTLIQQEIAAALAAVDGDKAAALAQAVMAADQVFLIGVGRVLISLKAMCKRLNHLGVRAWCVGDLNEGAITEKDLLIVGSGSGETAVPLQIARIAKTYGAAVVHIGSNPESSLAHYTDLFVRIPVRTKLNREEEIDSAQIMSSLFEQSLYLLCDSICLMIADEKQLDIKSLWRCHANLE